MKLFVYGTLKQGCRNNHYNHSKFLFPCETTVPYPMYKSRWYFPFLEDRPQEGNIIQGELYEVTEEQLIELDRFEDVPDLYTRGVIEVEFENTTVEAICYFKAENTDKTTDLISDWLE